MWDVRSLTPDTFISTSYLVLHQSNRFFYPPYWLPSGTLSGFHLSRLPRANAITGYGKVDTVVNQR